ncbi:MAG: Ig-like domain-containing protein [Paludibacteraceae bacterium]|nr:Ig-like domain-containing protein [Paludibacteraceae bacterium]MBQ6765031.1 Ig-like domain-containing protein [Paludibacteraceae bacterium]
MKRKLFIALTLLMAVAMQAQTYWNGTSNKVFSGSGTQADPYLISTPEQLAGLAERVNTDREDFAGKYIKLTADIYLTNFNDPDTASWKEWTPISGVFWGNYSEDEMGQLSGPKVDSIAFCGTFDGDGHTIYNVYYGQGAGWGDGFDPNDFDMAGWGSSLTDLDFSTWNKALFGQLVGGTIKNLNVSDARITGVSSVSLLVNYVREGSTISNCHVSGTTMGTGATGGGLVRSNDGLIENCTLNISSTGRKTSTDRGIDFGGLTFENFAHGVIRNCTVSGSADNGSGFVGQNFGLIENCTASVDITCGYGRKAPNSGYGFVEQNFGVIRNCVATGTLRGVGWLAGFCHENEGLIESCYATGDLYNTPLDGVTAHANMALFISYNCRSAVGREMMVGAGTCINCFGAGSCHVADEDLNVNNASGFVREYTSLQSAAKSRQANCYWNTDGLTHGTNKHFFRWAGTALTVAQMQSQAFVDELNKMAALCGTSTWEYRPGQFPRATGVKATNISDFLGGGDGTAENPYLISNKAQLENFQWFVNRGYDFRGEYLLQTADIALNAPYEQWEDEAPTRWTAIANRQKNAHFNEELVNAFCGTYNGGFHEVQNMYLRSTEVREGFFGTLADGAVIRNLGITGAYIRANNYVGILAGVTYNWNEDITISQCWTSGDVALENTSGGNNSSAFFNQETSHPVHVLNCRSSAKGVVGAIDANEVETYTSSTANYLFTGVAYSKTRSAYHHFINVWCDIDVLHANGVTRDEIGAATPKTTAYLQSKEAVNELNTFVIDWNQTHSGDEALNYWLWREGQYPIVSSDATYEPPITVTFQSNGGSAVNALKIETGSKITPPARPKRDGYFFVAWYTDEALTNIFDFDNAISVNTMLYAKWIDDTTDDYDLSLFNNEFATKFKIKTKQQLRGFAMAANGIYDFSQVLVNSGTQPVAIQTPMDFTGKTVTLENDILLNDTTDWQLWGHNVYAEPWLPIGTDLSDKYGFSAHPFTGTFDGQGHTISGLYVELDAVPSAMSGTWGLFGELGSGAVVKNVGIKASVLNGQPYENGAFRPAGYSTQSLCRPGLLAGKANGATVTNCFVQGKILVREKNYTSYAGGLIAQTTGSTITNCFARVDIDEENTYYCGLIGSNESGTVTNCYSAGHTFWGVVSYSSGVTSSYFDNNLTPNPTEFPYNNYPGQYGRSTNQMHAKTTFVNWDFETIWGRNDAINDGYPYLRAFYTNPPEDSEDFPLVTGVTIAPNDTVVLAGSPVQIQVTVLPENAVNKDYTLTLSPTYITWASIDENGVFNSTLQSLTSATYQYFTVQATTAEGGYQASTKITVWQPTMSIAWIDQEYRAGSNYMLTVEFTPENLTPSDITWTSSNTNVAAINASTGELSVLAEGTVTITASALNGQLQAQMEITILPAPIIAATGVKINEMTDEIASSGKTLYEGETFQLTATVLPANATDKTVTWRSSNTAYATVDENGLVTAVSGTPSGNNVSIYAETSNGHSASMNFHIKQPAVQQVILNRDSLTLRVGDTFQLEATVLPESVVDKSITWSSKNFTIATVSDGLVTAKKVGVVNIIARANFADGDVSDTCVVTVIPQPTKYLIRFRDWDNTILQSSQVEEGQMPVYTGETPTRPEDDQYTYTFSGWSPEIVPATENANYNAQYTAMPKTITPVYYTIRFLNYDGTELQSSQVLAGDVPVYNGATPTREDDEQYRYTFIGWQNENGENYTYSNMNNLPAASSNMDYTAQYRFTEIPKPSYTITFLNWDGELLEEYIMQEGEMPVYNGLMPTKLADAQYCYTFTGWTPEVVAVTGDATYTATFSSLLQKYMITFLDEDGTELCAQEWEYGSMPSCTEPTKADDEQYTYAFAGWTPTVAAVTGEATYTATYTATEKPEGFEDVKAEPAPQKVMIDGQIFILRGDKTYTLQGQEVK